jgi:hypothetical protein
MDATHHRALRDQVHRAARAVTLALTAGDLPRCRAALASAESELLAVVAALQLPPPVTALEVTTFADVDLKGWALRQLAERLAAELYRQRPPAVRRRARWQNALYVLCATSILLTSMIVGERRRWRQPEGLAVTYFLETNLTRVGWQTYAFDVLLEPADRPLPPWFGRSGFSARWDSWLVVPHSTNYVFQCQSRDGLRLFLDGRCVLDNWRDQTWEESLRLLPLALTAGLHELKVEYYTRRSHGAAVCVRWSGGSLPTNTVLAAPYLRKRP